jgi:phosphopantetheinyl transferase
MVNHATIKTAPILENSEALLAQLEHHEWYHPSVQRMGESRLREWLAVRVLLKETLGEEKQIVYSKQGKPYLADGSYHISISHTKGYVAIAIDRQYPVAIDIERISPRVENIRSRFISEEEESHLSETHRLTHLLLHWSAKESLFKMIDAPGIEFKTQLHIHPFEPVLNEWSEFTAHETRTAQQAEVTVRYIVAEDYVLTVIVG